ncbi:MAG: Glu-tRNA(Gln) amidotransferase GatDE subunit E [Methanobacteriota archaeon]|nr:MAG: Glu-tRNA(Gln) amidotransferase GatDE subunit E [Euryarchaeota archaeon]
MASNVKIGLEIHQRINTGKLFCGCSASLDEPLNLDSIYRELKAIKSELSEVDVAALMQEKRRTSFNYFYNDKSVCLVELDEEPPREPNREALLVALNIALQLHMDILPYAIFMRKMIIDGSNTSGFQRTALLAMGGSINTASGETAIQSIALEEESAGIMRDGQFRLDRLGIPLIEIATEPTIKSGAHCKEVAEAIGLLLRSTGYASRGIGTIRQDLNISIEGGARVEIKGAQDLATLPKWVDNEIRRQEDLIALLEELRPLPKIESSPVDVSDVVRGANANFIKKALSSGCVALAMRVEGHAGFLGRKVGTRRYGSEVSDYAKMAGVGGIIHSDEDMSKYGIDKEAVEKSLSCNEDDAFIIVIAEENKARAALNFAATRLNMREVPKETRKALPDGGSSFLRPLPGRARMYPETDVPHIEIRPLLDEAMSLVESFDKKVERLSKLLNKDLAYKIVKGRNLSLFEELSKEIEPKLVAITLEDTRVKIRRELSREPREENITAALMMYKEGLIAKRGIEPAIKMLEQGESKERIIDSLGKLTKEELKSLVESGKGMKEIMRDYGNRVDVEELQSILSNRG